MGYLSEDDEQLSYQIDREIRLRYHVEINVVVGRDQGYCDENQWKKLPRGKTESTDRKVN